MEPRRRIIPRIRVFLNFRKSIPDNEFDRSLDIDEEFISDIIAKINYWKSIHARYNHELGKRRQAAHELDMNRVRP